MTTNPNEVTEPSNAAFLIVSEWLQTNGTAARGDQLYEMCRFVEFVQSRSATSDAADAQRYQWLRGWGVRIDSSIMYSGEKLDTLVDGNMPIDKAIAAGCSQT